VSAVFEAWENEAMRQHVVPLAQALLDQIGGATVTVEFIGSCFEGSTRTTAVCIDAAGAVTGLPNFFEVAHELRAHLERFHAIHAAHDRPWLAMRLTITPDADFQLRYNYDDAAAFDRHRS